MGTTIEAVYENGVLRPLTPLPYRERQRVRIHAEPLSEFESGRRWGSAESLAQTFAEMLDGGGIEDTEWEEIEAAQKRDDLEDTQKSVKAIERLTGRRSA